MDATTLLLLVACSCSCALAQQCNLNNTEKFSPYCRDLNIEYPPVIYQDQNFVLKFHDNNEIYVTNVSLFTSNDLYCGRGTFVLGHQCKASELLVDSQNLTFQNVICTSTGLESPVIGEVQLVVELSGLVTQCAVSYATIWAQSTALSIVDINTGVILAVNDDNIFIVNSSISVICSTSSSGPYPLLSITSYPEANYYTPVLQIINSTTVVTTFSNRFSSNHTGLYSCTSVHNYTTSIFLVPNGDIPIVYYPDGNHINTPVGSFLNITANIITSSNEIVNPSTVQFVSNATNHFHPYALTYDNETFYIIFTAVGKSSSGSYDICFEYITTEVSDVASGQGLMAQCLGTFYLTVEVPSVMLSNDLVVRRPTEYYQGLVNVSCIPSDPNAVIHWQFLNTVPIWEAYPLYEFSPTGYNHTVTLLSPPNGIVVIKCGLLNPGSTLLANEQRITLVAVTRPVSIWNNNHEIFLDSIINSFRTFKDEGLFLSLRCFSEEGNGKLLWHTSDVESLPETLTEIVTDSIESLSIVGDGHDVTVNYANVNESDLGYYICRSNESGKISSVLTTLDDPYWIVVSPSYITAPIGSVVSLTVEYAYASEGHGNIGNGLIYSLEVIPFDASLPSYYALSNVSTNDSRNTYDYIITVSTSQSALYTFTAYTDNSVYEDTIQLQAIIPTFVDITNPVYALIGSRVHMSCFPNETTAPVLWGLRIYENDHLLNDHPGFSFTPSNLDYIVEFNLTTATFNFSNNIVDVDSGSYTSLQFVCAPKNGSSLSFISQYTSDIDLHIQNDAITLTNGRITIGNNSIINDDFNIEELGQSLRVLCTTVLGNDNPIFTANFFSSPKNQVFITHNYSSILHSSVINNYQLSLTAYVTQDTGGQYTCQSQVSQLFKTFIITQENPFINAQTNAITAFLGDNVSIVFLAAQNSNGQYNDLYKISTLFVSSYTSGVNTSFDIVQSCPSDGTCYQFKHTISFVRPLHAGTYYGHVHNENCEIGDCYITDFVTLSVEVPVIIPSSTTAQVIIGDSLSLSCNPNKGNFVIHWYHNGIAIPFTDCIKRNAVQSCLFPVPYYTNLYLTSVGFADSGNYTCSIQVYNETIIVQSILVTVVQECPSEFSNGIFWPATAFGNTASVPCTEAVMDQFVSDLYVTRQCSDTGNWKYVDYTNCLLNDEFSTFAIMWFKFVNAYDIIKSNITDTIRSYLSDNEIPYNSVNVHVSDDLVVFYLHLPFIDESTVTDTLIQFSTSSNTFDGYPTISQKSGVQIFLPSTTCSCRFNNPFITTLCFGGATSPCDCVDTICQCKTPFVGNGMYCTLDSDGDIYPNNPLTNCTTNSTEAYCIKDNCIEVYNPDQDPNACQMISNFTGCPYGLDPVWNILWANTPVNKTDRQPCPGQATTLGFASRTCLHNATWDIPNILDCLPVNYENFLNRIGVIRNSNYSIDVQLSQVDELVSSLGISVSQTLPNQVSQLPGVLNATNLILEQVIDLLYEAINTDTITNITRNLNILSIFDNLLNSTQVSGWQALWQANDSLGSDVLLRNAERYGIFLVSVNNEVLWRRNNIVISTRQYNVTDSETVTFPQPGDLNDTSFTKRKAYVSFPSELISERAKRDGFVSVVSLLFQNLEDFLPSILNRSNNTQAGSLVWSGQVSQFTGSTSNPINLTFGVDSNLTNSSTYHCVYWDHQAVQWSDAGVVTLDNYIDEDGLTLVNCQSYHLTAFSVLVDVSGSTKQINPLEYDALNVVSYIGCSISILCLFITVIFFLTQCKVLFKSVHLFVHLNLSIALLCGYIIFTVGVETARATTGGCIFVAALLQYFFLSSFSWMMCEGIMLYLMLVVVFSSLSKRWYFFLMLGWLPPFLPVVIGLAAGYESYGVRNENGDLLYCWLSIKNGVIWAFVAPMLIIIIINTVFLVMALVSIFRTKYRHYKVQKGLKRDLALSLFKASLILLPLLGLTWLFGLLSVNENTSVFAWIFTILNSLQGAAIFFCHVVRNEKVWKKLSPKLRGLRNRLTLKNSSEFSSSTSQSTLKYSDQKQNSTLKLVSFKKENEYEMTKSTDSSVVLINKEQKESETENDTKNISEKIKEKEKEVFKIVDGDNENSDKFNKDSVSIDNL